GGFLSLLPLDRRNDIAWLNAQFLTSGENPILRTIAVYSRHRYLWSTVETDADTIRYLDPSARAYLFPVPGDFAERTIRVPETAGRPGQPTLVHLFDPRRGPGDSVPTIRLDGNPLIMPDFADPFETAFRTGMMLSPGSHSLAVNSHGRELYLDIPVVGESPVFLTDRPYTVVSGSTENPPVFAVNGGRHGVPVRIHCRTTANMFDVECNGALRSTVQMVPETGEDEMYRGSFELLIPPGLHNLIFSSPGAVLEISVSRPQWIETSARERLRRDPFLETVIRYLDSPPDFETVRDQLSQSDLDPVTRAFWLALGSDDVRARSLLLQTGYDASLVSHRMLLAWLYSRTGYEHRALETAWPVVDDPATPYCHALYQALLKAALALGGPYRPVILAERILSEHPGDPLAEAVMNAGAGYPGASYQLSLDQLVRSPSPRFLPVPWSHLESGGEPLILRDGMIPGAEPLPGPRSPGRYYALTGSSNTAGSDVETRQSSDLIAFNLPEPMIVRFTVRPLGSDVGDPGLQSPIIVQMGVDDAMFQIEIPVTPPERETLVWEPSGTPACGPVAVYLPVLTPGKVQIRCIRGHAAITCSVQVPGLADRMIPPSDAPVLERYLELLKQPYDDIPAVFAEVLDLQRTYPDVYIFESLADLVEGGFRSRLLSGWPDPPAQRRYLSFDGLKHDPVTLLRSLDVPEPADGFDSLVFTRGQRAYFQPESLRTGTVECIVSGMPGMDYRMRVEIDRRTVGELRPDQPVLEIPWQTDRDEKLCITAVDVKGQYPVKIAVLRRSGDRRRPVPLYGNRRYYEVNPGVRRGIHGRIIAPVCLKLECRTLNPGGQPGELQVTAADVANRIVFSEIVPVSGRADPGARTIPDGQPVSEASDVLIPLPDRGIFSVSVRQTGGAAPGLVRAYALVPAEDSPVENTEALNEALTESPAETPTEALTGGSTERDTVENSVESAGDAADDEGTGATDTECRLPISWNRFIDALRKPGSRDTGVWGVRLSYRDRDRNPDDDIDDAFDVYSGDGLSGMGLWNRRIDPGAPGHRFYVELEAGGTLPSEEPDDPLFHAAQTATWYIGESGYRGRLSGAVD
ncbi:MAG TPA: hypothetical protein PLV45_11390, partial [bacterium]|nr:hypothetical protein [bacterium]